MENRLRIFRNIVSKISIHNKEAFRRVGIRISGNDFVEGGMSIKTNRPLVELMEKQGVAYWTVSAGIYETAQKKYEYMKNGDYYRYAAALSEFAKGVVVAQGGIRDPMTIANILEEKQSDMVGVAQALIADPTFLRKAFSGRSHTIVPCVECGRCRYIKRKDLTFDCVST